MHLLLLTAVALAIFGEYVTLTPHSDQAYRLEPLGLGIGLGIGTVPSYGAIAMG